MKMKCKNCNTKFHKLGVHGECPKCNTKYSTITNQSELRLRELQEMYLELKSKNLNTNNVIECIYSIFKSYSKSIYLKSFSNESYDPTTIDSYCHDASILIIESFILKDGYQISKSFGGALKQKLFEVIHGKKFNFGYHN